MRLKLKDFIIVNVVVNPLVMDPEPDPETLRGDPTFDLAFSSVSSSPASILKPTDLDFPTRERSGGIASDSPRGVVK